MSSALKIPSSASSQPVSSSQGPHVSLSVLVSFSFFFFVFKTKFCVTPADLKLTVRSRMTLNFWSSSLHLRITEITGVYCHVQITWYWGSNLRLCACHVNTIPVESHARAQVSPFGKEVWQMHNPLVPVSYCLG